MVPSHYLNHCWIIIDLTLGSTFQWNLLQNTTYFTQENASEDVVCKIAAILAWSQSVKMWEQSYTAISTAKIETANLQRLGPKLWFATAYQCYPCRGTTLKSRGRRWLAGSQRQHWPANRNMLSLLLISQLATGRWYRIEEKVGNVGVVSPVDTRTLPFLLHLFPPFLLSYPISPLSSHCLSPFYFSHTCTHRRTHTRVPRVRVLPKYSLANNWAPFY